MNLSANPYAPEQPCSDPERFFGRAETFAFLRQALHSEQTPILIGGRGMGKTSVLLQLPFQLEARYLTAYLDLAELRHTYSLSAFAVALIQTARQALRTAEPSLYLPDVPETQDAAELWRWFAKTHLTPIFDVMRRFQRLIYCFDNAQHLLDAVQRGDLPSDLIDSLGALCREEKRIGIVFTFDAAAEPRLASYALLAEPLNQHRLPPLSDAEARQLITQPCASFYALSDDVVGALQAYSGGQPYLLQWLCALLWERAAARNFAAPDRNDVSAILPRALQVCSALFDSLWQNATPSEQAALIALTQARRGAPATLEELHTWLIHESEDAPHMVTLAAALRSLEYRGAVRSAPESAYALSSGLLYLWLQAKAELPSAPLNVEHTSVRRAALPIALIAIASASIALLVAALTSHLSSGAATLQPTHTLALNLEGTQRALSLTQTFQALPTNTPTATLTFTASPTRTSTVTATASPTRTFTVTATASPTRTFTATPTFTASPTRTFTATPTFTASPTRTFTITPTFTASPTRAFTATAAATLTATDTLTPSLTATFTATPSQTFMPTATITPSSTQTHTATATPTRAVMPSATSTALPPF